MEFQMFKLMANSLKTTLMLMCWVKRNISLFFEFAISHGELESVDPSYLAAVLVVSELGAFEEGVVSIVSL